MTYFRHKVKGLSLIEVLLVLAIMATVMVSILGYTTQKSDEMRRDKTVMQVEQLLNAGMSYYLSFGSWPAALTNLQGSFLPTGTIKNPWGQSFIVGANTGTAAGSQFSVCTMITGKQAFTAATVIAGRLPIASAVDGTTAVCPMSSTAPCTTSSTTCTVVSSVNIPGQNLNNARSINFAGLYHNGACIAAPSCPLNMVPTVVVTPVSVSGLNQNDSKAYSIASFTAYATGASDADSTGAPKPGLSPLDCNQTTAVSCSLPPNSNGYWRACIRIVTQKGPVLAQENILFGYRLGSYRGNEYWARDAGVILALTRCMPVNEPFLPQVAGSAFTVFTSD